MANTDNKDTPLVSSCPECHRVMWWNHGRVCNHCNGSFVPKELDPPTPSRVTKADK